MIYGRLLLMLVAPPPTTWNLPSRSLSEVRFRRFLGVLYVVSLIQFHGTKLFEMAAEMAGIRAQLYGRTNLVRPYSWSSNLLEAPIAVGFLLELLINSKLTIFLVLDSFPLRHIWSKNYVHGIHRLT